MGNQGGYVSDTVWATIRAAIRKAIPPHVHAFDAFDRADTLAGNLGTAPSGRPWVLSEPGGASAKIAAGRYQSDVPGTTKSTYAFQTLPYPVRAMRCGISWADTSTPQVVAFAASKYPETGFTSNLIHPIVSPTVIELQKFVGGVFTSLHTVALSLSAGTVYEFGWSIVDNVVTVDYPGGSFSIVDPDFPPILGRTAYFQISDTGTSTGAVRFEWVEAFAAAEAVLA